MRKKEIRSMRTPSILAASAAGAVALFLAASAAQADNFPGGRQERDWVTGLLCVGTCATVRMQSADCICQKVNPGETDLRKLKLRCWGTEHGRWVACPVQPRYGIPVN